LDKYLNELGFIQSSGDPCLYISSEGGNLILAVYVDDIVIAGKSIAAITKVKQLIANRYEVRDLGEMKYFLGIEIRQDINAGKIWLGQPAYTEQVLKKFSMENCKSIDNPSATSIKLTKSPEKETFDTDLYRSAVGSLLYLSTKTRPDITYAVSNVAKFCDAPNVQHWNAVKRIFRYLRGTTQYGLLYNRASCSILTGFSDADFAGDIADRKSTSGYNFQLSGAAVSWRSKKQTCVSLSTMEAEYTALAHATQEAVWLRRLLSDLGHRCETPTVINEDNQSAIALAKSITIHGRS
jgi:hypothetical protein